MSGCHHVWLTFHYSLFLVGRRGVNLYSFQSVQLDCLCVRIARCPSLSTLPPRIAYMDLGIVPLAASAFFFLFTHCFPRINHYLYVVSVGVIFRDCLFFLFRLRFLQFFNQGIGEFDRIPGKPYTIRDHFPAAPVPSGKYSLHRMPGKHPPPVLPVNW